jgi:hypothetical protein
MTAEPGFTAATGLNCHRDTAMAKQRPPRRKLDTTPREAAQQRRLSRFYMTIRLTCSPAGLALR